MDGYYDNINTTLLEALASDAHCILELGCGGGGMARAVRTKLGKKLHYVGVDISLEALNRGVDVLDIALHRNLDSVPNWDDDDEMAIALPYDGFDHVICGDVLEHLYAPEQVLTQAVKRLAPGGKFLACIPNVQHWSVFAQLVIGSWPRIDAGLFDRTHIRWFALTDMVSLINDAGLLIEAVIPRVFEQERGREVMEYLEPLAIYLGVNPDVVMQRGLPLQYVIVARKPATNQFGII